MPSASGPPVPPPAADPVLPAPNALARDDPRLRALIADIGGRLRPVLTALPSSEFDTLVEQMAQRQLRWDAVAFVASTRDPHPPFEA